MSNSSSSSSKSTASASKNPQDSDPSTAAAADHIHSSPTARSHHLTPPLLLALGFHSTSSGSRAAHAAGAESATAHHESGTGRKRKWGQLGEEEGTIRIIDDEKNNGDESVERRELSQQVITGIEDDDDDEHEDDQIVAKASTGSGGQIKIAGKEESTVNLHVYNRRRERVSYEGRLGKEKVIEIVDSDSEAEAEAVMVSDSSNRDFGVCGELMEHMQALVKAFVSSLAPQHLLPHLEIPQEILAVDIPPSPRMEQRRNRPAFARFPKPQGQQAAAPTQDEVPMPHGPTPFSTAMDKLQERAAAIIGDDAHIPWTPSNHIHRGFLGLKMLTCKEIALINLAQHAEALTSLVGIPNDLRNHLCFILCRARKMSLNLLTMLMEGKLTDLKLSDCSWASQKDFQDAFANFDKSNLEVLELDRCGRCMPDSVVHCTLSCGLNSLPKLKRLSLKGHYSLSDKGLDAIVSSAPLLNSVNLSQCSLLTTEGIINVIDKQALLLKELYIDECQNVDAMSLLPSLKQAKALEILSIAAIPSVSNEFVHELIPVCGSTIMELNFADCDKLTSSAIKVIGEHCPNLLALDIRNLTQLKDSAIAHLANGCRAIHKLQLSKTSFSDEVIAAFVRASGEQLVELSLNKVSKVGNLTAIAIADVCRFHLKKLDLSFCYHMDDNALGTIVDSCSSLKTLKLFGCSQVTDLFLKGYFNRSVRILGVNGISLDYIEIPDF